MNRYMRTVSCMVLCFLFIVVPSIWAYWDQNGAPLCTAVEDQAWPTMTTDGAGGAIVAWHDYRSGDWDIYAQRVNPSGTSQWMADGVAICTASGIHTNPRIVSDGAGGAIVAWSGSLAIYAQRVDASGVVQWTVDGVRLCESPASATDKLSITSDGAGGAIVAWVDTRVAAYQYIYAQRVDSTGTVQWTASGVPVCEASAIGMNVYATSITSDGAGGAIVSWGDVRDYLSRIYAQRIDSSGAIQWTTDGIAICTITGVQTLPVVTSDGSSGAIVAWIDSRNGNDDIFAQRVNASGTLLWTANGVPLCVDTEDQNHLAIDSDGAGGAIATWRDDRNGNADIYAQRVSVSGTVLWTADGVGVCMAIGSQFRPTVTSDGAGGSIVTWEDLRSGVRDIYARRVDSSGAAQWTIDGVALCTAMGEQYNPKITFDGAGGAIVTWSDYRSTGGDIYAQRVDNLGRVGYFASDILSVQDVPGDQGGLVRIIVARSELDDVLESEAPVATYNVWQRIDDPALLTAIDLPDDGGVTGVQALEEPLTRSLDISSVSSWPIRKTGGRCFVSSSDVLATAEFPSGTWELLGSFAACQQDEYIYRAGTLADSTASGIPYAVYLISAHTVVPSLWALSEPDSGYSVDNLPPDIPESLTAEQSFAPEGLALSWDVNAENDLSHYAVYRGASDDFVPVSGNRIAAGIEPEHFDDEWRWDSDYCYKVSAIDVHGNESGFALLLPGDVTGDEPPKMPGASYLAQNYPNPFNPITRIEFGLDNAENVSLRIYDPAGRLVRILAGERRPAGHYAEVWDGKDGSGRPVSSGVYFYNLKTGSFTETRKMILLR